MTLAAGTTTRRVPSALTGLLWSVLVLLVITGVAASVGRAMFVDDFGSRMDPARTRTLDALGITDPHMADRPAEVARVDNKYAAHPGLILPHIVPGAVFLLLAPFQFSKRIRSRHPRFHRWSGRALLLIAILCLVPGLYFGLVKPFAGAREASLVAFMGAYSLVAMTQGYVAIRGGQRARHREWMIRLFAAAIGISTVRLIAGVVEVVFVPHGYRPPTLFAISITSGWLLTIAVAELWIRYTRPRPLAERVIA